MLESGLEGSNAVLTVLTSQPDLTAVQAETFQQLLESEGSLNTQMLEALLANPELSSHQVQGGLRLLSENPGSGAAQSILQADQASPEQVDLIVAVAESEALSEEWQRQVEEAVLANPHFSPTHLDLAHHLLEKSALNDEFSTTQALFELVQAPSVSSAQQQLLEATADLAVSDTEWDGNPLFTSILAHEEVNEHQLQAGLSLLQDARSASRAAVLLEADNPSETQVAIAKTVLESRATGSSEEKIVGRILSNRELNEDHLQIVETMLERSATDDEFSTTEALASLVETSSVTAEQQQVLLAIVEQAEADPGWKHGNAAWEATLGARDLTSSVSELLVQVLAHHPESSLVQTFIEAEDLNRNHVAAVTRILDLMTGQDGIDSYEVAADLLASRPDLVEAYAEDFNRLSLEASRPEPRRQL